MKIKVTQRSKAHKIKVYNFTKKYTDSPDTSVERFWAMVLQDAPKNLDHKDPYECNKKGCRWCWTQIEEEIN